MYSQILYLPKFGEDAQSEYKEHAIDGIKSVAATFDIPVIEWNDLMLVNYKLPTLIVSLGGDGTMLTAMREAINFDVAHVLGINFGKLGFLTAVDELDISGIDPDPSIARATYVRFLTELFKNDKDNNWKLSQKNTLIADVDGKEEVAVNEFLITTNNRRIPISYQILINDELVADQSGDGIIVSTATGSTAYALSAGGVIMSPNSTSMQLVPLAAHTINSRPVIVDQNDNITIRVPARQRVDTVTILNDGHDFCEVSLTGNIYVDIDITAHKQVDVWYPKNRNFFNVLSEKMNW